MRLHQKGHREHSVHLPVKHLTLRATAPQASERPQFQRRYSLSFHEWREPARYPHLEPEGFLRLEHRL